jgi:hypothetical protein
MNNNKLLYNIVKIAAENSIGENLAIGGISALGTGAGMIGGKATGIAARDAIASRWDKILERLYHDTLKNDLVRPAKVFNRIARKGLNPLLLANLKYLPGVGKILGGAALGLTSGLTANQLIRKPQRII